jgi:hypothetical protein
VSETPAAAATGSPGPADPLPRRCNLSGVTRRDLAAGLRRVVDAFPVSARGLWVAALAAVALRVYGYGTLDLIAFTAGLGGLALVALCSAAATLAALLLRRTRGTPADPGVLSHIEAGVPVETGFSMPGLERLPLIGLGWSWVDPASVQVRVVRRDGRARELVVAGHRAHAPALVRRFAVGDAFGLARVAWTCREASPVTILPSLGRLRRIPAVHSRAGADGLSHPAGTPEGDRMDIRRYAPGDPARDILWKVFARTRQLNVRIRERSLERARRTVAYLLAAAGDEPAAAAARLALESGSLGRDWIFGADGTKGTLDDLDAAHRAIARSGSVEPGAETGLGAFLGEVSGLGVESCVVFAPARAGRWTARVLALAARQPGRLSFVLAAERVLVPSAPPPLWRRLLYATPQPEGVSPAELRALLGQVAASGCDSVLVERATGRSLGSDLRESPAA